ncbi:MAG: four helix bundle protein [Aliarcobacter sp.]
MERENLIRDEAFSFALQIMELAKTLRQKKEYELSSQLWRSGTSIGANMEEAQAGQSRADFMAKMTIASKESREALYWLRLADKGKIISSEEMAPVREQCERIVRILTSIVKTARTLKDQSKIQNSGAKRKITTAGGAYHNGRGQVIGANQESKIL